MTLVVMIIKVEGGDDGAADEVGDQGTHLEKTLVGKVAHSRSVLKGGSEIKIVLMRITLFMITTLTFMF